jgi:hypothetical protein
MRGEAAFVFDGMCDWVLSGCEFYFDVGHVLEVEEYRLAKKRFSPTSLFTIQILHIVPSLRPFILMSTDKAILLPLNKMTCSTNTTSFHHCLILPACLIECFITCNSPMRTSPLCKDMFSTILVIGMCCPIVVIGDGILICNRVLEKDITFYYSSNTKF